MARRSATFEDLLSKPVRTMEKVLKVPSPDGGTDELVVLLKAIKSEAYDELLAAHPPTKKQKESGETHNSETFPPALIAACMSDPQLTGEQALEIWTDPKWSRGELGDLFFSCVEVNSKGLDVPFT